MTAAVPASPVPVVRQGIGTQPNQSDQEHTAYHYQAQYC